MQVRDLSGKYRPTKKEYGRNRSHNMSEEKKQKIKEYQKNYREANKRRNSSFIKKMHDYIHYKPLILQIFFLISLCPVLAN